MVDEKHNAQAANLCELRKLYTGIERACIDIIAPLCCLSCQESTLDVMLKPHIRLESVKLQDMPTKPRGCLFGCLLPDAQRLVLALCMLELLIVN